MAATDPSHDVNRQQATYWTETAGPHWVRQQHGFDMMLASFGAQAHSALDPKPGERILDVGCGTGTATRRLAEAVGLGGAVRGVDISSTMIDAARVTCADLAQCSFAVADAQVDALAGTDAPFDAVFSRFGVMFFEDPVAAFANICAAVHSAGRLSFACWQHEDLNEWIALPARIMRGFTPQPLFAPPNAPGPFAFHDADRVRGILDAGGWTDVVVRPFSAPTIMGGNTGLDAAIEQTMGTSVGQILRQQVDDATFAEAATAVRTALQDHLVGDAVVFDGNVWIVTATKAG